MTNYENEIMDSLKGDTPRQKYDFLNEIIKIFRENNDNVESILLNICHDLNKKGEWLYKSQGTGSYTERCDIHDAEMLIYSLTNKSKLEKMDYIKWRESVQSKSAK